ncbi:hypothetical protein [Pseudomonas protegens]|nr:hypothetical protein [Pseudomonas protegens]
METIEQKQKGWTPEKMAEVDPSANNKMRAIRRAQRDEKIEYLHAQIFFDSQGGLNKLVGEGSGLQLNTW